jgi:histone-lysine N-methyltransferase SETMAR
MIYYELLTGGETVTADMYINQLCKLAAALQEKRRRMVEVHLLHDNARPHAASATRQQLEELGWTTVPHPPYSPDLAPSDYHLFRSLKSFLHGQRFSNFDNLKSSLANFFEHQPTEFWEHGIQSLPNRWRRVIDTFGDYIVD